MGSITDMTSDYSPIMGLSPVENYYIDAAGEPGVQGDADLRQNNGRAGSDGWQGTELIQPFELARFDRFKQVNEMGATAASH